MAAAGTACSEHVNSGEWRNNNVGVSRFFYLAPRSVIYLAKAMLVTAFKASLECPLSIHQFPLAIPELSSCLACFRLMLPSARL
jgi:hypothetical protein